MRVIANQQEVLRWLPGRAQLSLAESNIGVEPFQRMVFNILTDNTDDHEKSHALLTSDSGELSRSPAHDVLPAAQSLGYQQISVGKQEADSSLKNAVLQAASFGFKPGEAQSQVRAVAQIADNWQSHFAQNGVTAKDIAALADCIDRPFLRDQRRAALV